MELDLAKENAQLRDKSAGEIIEWANSLGETVFASTSFAPKAAVTLDLIQRHAPGMPVVWADSGYNVPDTYRTAQRLIDRLKPNLKVYSPDMTSERRNAITGGIPHPDDHPDLFAQFVKEVKLEPFQKALDEIKPKIWITGIRKSETAFRETLDILSYDNRGLLRVAPIFYWTEEDIDRYLAEHDLPSAKHYFDPTKIAENAECGLHTAA